MHLELEGSNLSTEQTGMGRSETLSQRAWRAELGQMEDTQESRARHTRGPSYILEILSKTRMQNVQRQGGQTTQTLQALEAL